MARRQRVSGFPGMDERRALIQQLQELEYNASPQFQAYTEAIRSLDRMMERYSRLDLNGLAPALTEENRTELLEAIRQTALAGESYLAAAEQSGMKLNEGTPALVEELQGLLSVDYNVLNQYREEFRRSLPELQDDARTLTVDIRGVELDHVGGAQSSRIPMTVVGADGSRREGFFTARSELDVQGSLQDYIDAAKRECDPQGRQELDKFVTSYMEYLKKDGTDLKSQKNWSGRDPSGRPDLALCYLSFHIPEKGKFKSGFSREFLKNVGLDVKKLSGNALKIMDRGFQALRDNQTIRFGLNLLALQDGARLDSRNAAMSSVAELLGVPKIAAKAVPMRCINENGETVEGTFMEKAEGYNLENTDDKSCKAYARVDEKAPYEKGSDLVKELSELQVLDYLCANVDRHGANMFYKVNDAGKIVGVQAIDNDASFGRFSGAHKNRHRMVGLENLAVMSEDMAERISSMTPEMLKLSLRGQSLGKEEITAACRRLKDLQEKIKTAHRCPETVDGIPELDENPKQLNILTDAQMKAVDFTMLAGRYENSLFHTVKSNVDKSLIVSGYHGYNRAYFRKHPREFQSSFPGAEVSTSERKYTAGGMADALGEAARGFKNEATGFEIKEATGYWRRSSGEFRDMVRAAEQASKVQKRLAKTFSREVDRQKLLRDDEAVRAEKELSDATMRNLENQTDKYLARKMRQRHVDNVRDLLERANGPYERQRIQYALDMKKAVDTYRRLDDPSAEAERQEKLDVQNRLETQAKRQENKREQAPAAEINLH